MNWRGVELTEVAMGGGATRWISAGSQWKAVQYRENDVWYARLRLGVHRFPGQGATAVEALDAAYAEARVVRRQLARALTGVVKI